MRSQLLRAVVASTVGTSIEWYDYFAYGTVGALVFPELFFPGSDHLSGVLDTFTIFFLGFAARPVGALVFGHMGDRIGRRATLIVTLLLMGFATCLIGLLPGRAAIGVAAPLLLTLLRILQGIGVGGEWGGSVLLSMEWSRGHRRGFVASWPQLGVPMGLLLSTGVVAVMLALAPGAAFANWGWRVPFLLSIALVGVGLYIRLGVLETPVFARLLEDRRIEFRPVAEALRLSWREIVLSAVLRLPEQAPFYVFTVFVYTFGQDLKIQPGLIASAVVVASLLSLASLPFFGWLSDRIGRKRMYLVGIGTMAAWGFVYFGLFATAVAGLVFLVIVLSLVPHDMQYGPQSSLIAESFTGRIRYSGASMGYQLASVIAGGPAPYIAAALYGRTHNAHAISLYVLGCCVLGFVAAALIRDRSRQDISVEYDDATEPAAPLPGTRPTEALGPGGR